MARWFAIGWLVMLPACSPVVKGTYDPGRFADWPIDPAKKLDGCVTLSTTAEEDAFVWRGGPKGRVAKTVTLEVPLGLITREAAARVFGDLFRGGLAKDAGSAAAGCRVVVTPRPTQFAWVDHVFSPPQLEVSVRIEARTASGETLVSKEYSARWRAGVAYRKIPAEDVVPAAHPAVQSLMLQAAGDVKAALERATPGAPAAPGG